MNKNIVLALVAILVIATTGLFFPRGNTIVQQVLGAVSTLDGVDNPWVSINGVKFYYYSQSITATSSIPCISPVLGATSTLQSYSVNVTNAGTMAVGTLDVSTTTGTGGYGSSTPALVFARASFATPFSFAWQPNWATTTDNSISEMTPKAGVLPGSTPEGTSNYTIKPSEQVTLRYATATPRTLTSYWSGTCSAVFKLD